MHNLVRFSALFLCGAMIAMILVFTPSSQAQDDPCREVLINGDMEGISGWVFPNVPARGGYDAGQYLSPVRSARLGIISGDNTVSYSSARQQVSAPAADHLVLSWHLYPLSQPFDAKDQQIVSILNDQNLGQLRRIWSGIRNDAAWLSCSYDISEFADKSFWVYFGVRNDGADGVSAMYVDDVSLQACSAPQTTLEGCQLATATPALPPSPSPSPTATSTPTVTSTQTPTATPTEPVVTATPTPTSTPVGPACEQLVANPEFDQGEDGYDGWQQNLIFTSTFRDLKGVRHNGAWFGGADLIEHYLYQDIPLPASAPILDLSYWWALNPPTYDAALDAGEALTVTVRNLNDDVLQSLQVIDGDSDRRLWRPATYDLTPYLGQTIRLHFHATTETTTTSWHLANVRLYTCDHPIPQNLPLIFRR